MLKKIKRWIHTLKLIHVDPEIELVTKQVTCQEDPSAKEAVKRVRKAFQQQAEQMHAMAMKPHSCKDPLSCTKSKCFKWKPDKIVSTAYEVEDAKSVKQRTKKNRDIIKKMDTNT